MGTLSTLTSLHGGGGGIGELNSHGSHSCDLLSSLTDEAKDDPGEDSPLQESPQ